MKKKNIFSFLILFLLFISIEAAAYNINQQPVKERENDQIHNETIPADHPWPMFHHDTKHTGQTNSTGPATPTIAWKFHVDNGIVSSAAISNNNTIYVGSGWNLSSVQKGSLYAFYSNGTLKWKHTVSNGFFSSPTIGPNNVIYITSLDGELHAIRDDETKATTLWTKPLKFFFNLCSPLVDKNGIIHVGSPSYEYFQIYPNGVLKWIYKTDWCIISSAAIDDNGIVYIGSKDHHLYAFNSDPPGLQWKFKTGDFYDGHLVDSSPAIGKDGTIYVGTDPYGAYQIEPIDVKTNVWAVYPNGTLKWVFETEDGCESSPAIGPDNSIYIGSYDGYLYALTDEQTHATLQWKYKTNGPIDGSPIVDGDGSIYVGSRDGYLYAVYPNGTLKWKLRTGNGFESSPSIDDKGYLYIGGFDEDFYCIGTGKPDVGIFSVDFSSHLIPESMFTPKISIRNNRAIPSTGTITCSIINNNTVFYNESLPFSFSDDGTEQFMFPDWPVVLPIGSWFNVSIIITCENDDNFWNNERTLQLFITENNPPIAPLIYGPKEGTIQTEYIYEITANDMESDQVYYQIDWNDDTSSDWIGPFLSGQTIYQKHIWEKKGSYEIKVKAKDSYGAESDWSYYSVSMPKNTFLSIRQMFFGKIEMMLSKY